MPCEQNSLRQIAPRRRRREGRYPAYTRVSKADGSQVHDLQHDAPVAAGVDPKRIHKDSISGIRDSRSGLDQCLTALAPGTRW
jgi:DNA invertase Pin-like site-specific DNA recombinase